MKTLLNTLALCLIATASWAYDVKVDGIFYNINKADMTATVTYGDVQGYYEYDIVVPETITSDGNEYTITALGDSAFWYCRKMTSLKMPATVKSIGDYCMTGCESLTDIAMSNNIEVIGDHAFAITEALETLVFPEALTYVKTYAFFRTGIKSVVLPDALETIETYAFSQMEKATEVTFGKGLKNLGSSAFADCQQIETVELPAGVDTLRMYTFEGCSALKEIKLNEGLKHIGERALAITSINNVVIPNSVESIEECAFRYNRSLKKITFGSGIKNIADWLFYNRAPMHSLDEIVINAIDVPQTHVSLFQGCNVDNCILYVPAESVERYMNSAPWNTVKAVKAIETTGIDEVPSSNGLSAQEKYRINDHISIRSFGGKNIKVAR